MFVVDALSEGGVSSLFSEGDRLPASSSVLVATVDSVLLELIGASVGPAKTVKKQ